VQLQEKKSQKSVPQHISYIKSLYRRLSRNGCGCLLLLLLLLLLLPGQLLLLTFAFDGDTRVLNNQFPSTFTSSEHVVL
jgi:hypothetical protein